MARHRSAVKATGEIMVRFPEKFYRLGEVVEHSGVSRQTIHNYSTIGLISESTRTMGGQRLFDETVFLRLERIEELKPTHSLRQIKSILDTESGEYEQIARAVRSV
ncbi:MAG: MerR family DNA-binding transcriptional regulator [Planctomycetia bacterium]|nr:MerR family DNA-binding transcriptional regulator [Planctomycetia bacterium]